MEEVLLTIAIPTIKQRKKIFDELYMEFVRQTKLYGEQIEIIYLCDNKEMTIGAKRQKLNDTAKGKYVVQWDDDDWIHPNGIDMIMEGISSNSDVISYNYSCDIKLPIEHNSVYPRKVSIGYNNSFNNLDKLLYMTPDPKNPIKREILHKIKFQDTSWSEEYYFKLELMKYLKTEYKINEDIYQILNRSGEPYDFNVRYNLTPNKLM